MHSQFYCTIFDKKIKMCFPNNVRNGVICQLIACTIFEKVFNLIRIYNEHLMHKFMSQPGSIGCFLNKKKKKFKQNNFSEFHE